MGPSPPKWSSLLCTGERTDFLAFQQLRALSLSKYGCCRSMKRTSSTISMRFARRIFARHQRVNIATPEKNLLQHVLQCLITTHRWRNRHAHICLWGHRHQMQTTISLKWGAPPFFCCITTISFQLQVLALTLCETLTLGHGHKILTLAHLDQAALSQEGGLWNEPCPTVRTLSRDAP